MFDREKTKKKKQSNLEPVLKSQATLGHFDYPLSPLKFVILGKQSNNSNDQPWRAGSRTKQIAFCVLKATFGLDWSSPSYLWTGRRPNVHHCEKPVFKKNTSVSDFENYGHIQANKEYGFVKTSSGLTSFAYHSHKHLEMLIFFAPFHAFYPVLLKRPNYTQKGSPDRKLNY